MTVYPSLDFETYSEAGFVWDGQAYKWGAIPNASQGRKGLKVVGAAAYAEHPTTEVLTLSYDLLDGAGMRRWQPGSEPPVALFKYLRGGGLLGGWNTAFEHHIWNKTCVTKYSWPPLPQRQLRCTAARARAYGLPGKLDAATKVMGWAQKDAEGQRLIKKFCIPRTPTKGDPRLRITPAGDPEDGEKLYFYCDQDVRAESEAASHLPELEGEELEFWLADQAINYRGVQIDVEGVHNLIEIVEQLHLRYNEELRELASGWADSKGRKLEQASQLQRMIGWLHSLGVHTDSLDEEHLTALLAGSDLCPVSRRALELRQALGSAAVKKVFAMRNIVAKDGRLHDLFNYHAARTGRATGEGPQPTNLPNSGPEVRKCGSCSAYFAAGRVSCPGCGQARGPGKPLEWCPEAAEFVLELAKARSMFLLQLFFGDAMSVVSGCLRALFTSAPGHDLIGSDYSSIEAVVLAELAGEEWRKDVFSTHGKIYEMSAAKISGIPFDEFMEHAGYTQAQRATPGWWEQKPGKEGSHHPLRKTIGKVAELASGYQGWLGSWKAFGADEFMTEEEMKNAILAWRAASPAIVELWGGQERNWKPEYYGVEGMFVQAILYPGTLFKYRSIEFVTKGDAVSVRLPSGRELTYHRPRLGKGRRGYSISFEGWNTNPKNGPMGWIRIETWGGRLVENITQATARDILRHAIVNLEAAGYGVVLHVYDEVIVEVPEGRGSVEDVERIMMILPDWAASWVIRAAGGWRGKRYRKG